MQQSQGSNAVGCSWSEVTSGRQMDAERTLKLSEREQDVLAPLYQMKLLFLHK